MMRKNLAVLGAAILISASSGALGASSAQAAPNAQTAGLPQTAAADYCGQDPWTSWVPDRPAGYDFSSACYGHDVCRSTLANTRANAIYCHDQFYGDMSAICTDVYRRAWRCYGVANIYFTAVKWFNTPGGPA
jgi:hypothetical protein